MKMMEESLEHGSQLHSGDATQICNELLAESHEEASPSRRNNVRISKNARNLHKFRPPKPTSQKTITHSQTLGIPHDDMSVDSDLPVTEVSIQDTLKTAETGQEFTVSTSSNDSVETINAEMQLEATADSHDLHPSNRRKTHKHLKVMTDLGRRRYDRREPYKSLSKRSDTSLSDDSTSNESRHRINHQNMTDSNTGVDNNTSVDLERNTNSFSFTKPIVSTNPGATKDPPADDTAHSPSQSLFEGKTYSQEEWILIEKFWKAYDEVLILSLFSILGILFRLLFATWFSTFDNVFNENSALFTNLPLNCFSCWLMGFLCSGNEALDIVFKRMASGTTVMDDRTRTRTKSWQQQDTIHTSSHINQPRPKGRIIRRISETIMRTRSESPSRLERESTFIRNKLAQAEMREVQLLALERRIRASPSLVLFPAKKQDIDVIEHYANGSEDATENRILRKKSTQQLEDHSTLHNGHSKNTDHDLRGGSAFTTHTSTSKFSHAWKTFSKVNIADGWDVGTTADAMKDGILLGLRVGFCGALSSFSSWNSDMVSLLCNGYVDSAIVGYILGLLVPIVSYRTGQHSAVYVFVWRCRRETLRDERRGTQLKVSLGDDDDDADLERTISETIGDGSVGALVLAKRRKKRPKNDGGRILDEEAITRSIPSIRALVTAISCTILIGFISSLVFYAHDDAIVSTSWSLLFSPMGGFARRTLTMNYNNYFQSFPLGSFACNMLGCALSGGLGAIIAGNPDPGQHIALLSSISGFAGSLSAFTSFLIEVLERIDPILLNSDGVLYALWTIFSALLIGVASSQTKDWADRIG